MHNLPGSRLLEPDAGRASAEREAWRSRRIGWMRTIVEADVRPQRVMNEFKSYASRELNRLDREGPDRKRWARHGSTRWLWKDLDVQEAIQYVIDEQGELMALFGSLAVAARNGLLFSTLMSHTPPRYLFLT